jgi:hypothetical protein
MPEADTHPRASSRLGEALAAATTTTTPTSPPVFDHETMPSNVHPDILAASSVPLSTPSLNESIAFGQQHYDSDSQSMRDDNSSGGDSGGHRYRFMTPFYIHGMPSSPSLPSSPSSRRTRLTSIGTGTSLPPNSQHYLRPNRLASSYTGALPTPSGSYHSSGSGGINGLFLPTSTTTTGRSYYAATIQTDDEDSGKAQWIM